MIRIIDRKDDKVVQKVVSPQGKLLRYQYGVPGKGMTQASSLAECRAAIGKFPAIVKGASQRPVLSLKSA